jgi:hypothetical protein
MSDGVVNTVVPTLVGVAMITLLFVDMSTRGLFPVVAVLTHGDPA